MMLNSTRAIAPAGAIGQARPAVAPKPRNVSAQAVRDVFMPALSSTMTEVSRPGRSMRNARWRGSVSERIRGSDERKVRL